MKEAMFYEKLDDGKVKCNLCSHHCTIADGKRGICGVRENSKGILNSLVYGKIIAKNVDPIEKKPFFHFLPGTRAYSIGTVGCNFRCLNCQNFDISQEREILGVDMTPQDVVDAAITSGSKAIAYTYNEPTIFYEFMFDVCVLAREKGLHNVLVSNGYMSKEALEFLAPHIDAINFDLKFFNDESYRKVAGAKLQPVLDSIKLAFDLGLHVEVTTLVIPAVNDSNSELKQIAEFVYSVDRNIPWHVSAFYPMFKMSTLDPTSVETLKRAYDIGKEVGLNFVYVGNVPGMCEDTICPVCGDVCVKRYGYDILENHLDDDGKCSCGEVVLIR